MSVTIDWTKPKTFRLSKSGYTNYINDSECLCNTVARKDPSESLTVTGVVLRP
jgi:hypothetical protein